MIIVHIDTSDNKKTSVAIEKEGERDMLERAIQPRSGQVVLELLDELLQSHTLTLQDISAIQVVVGPGSFTGLRVGVAVANTLAYTLNIPLNNGKPGEPVEPVYE